MSRRTKPLKEYRDDAKRLKRFFPSLSKYIDAETLTPQQKAAITRRVNQFGAQPSKIFHLSKDQAKKLGHHKTLAPGSNAIRLTDTAKGARITVNKNGVMRVKESGRVFKYFPLPGEDSIDFEIQELAERLYDDYKPLGIYLWTHMGRSYEFPNPRAFAAFMRNYWNTYENQEQWVHGVAILLSEDGL